MRGNDGAPGRDVPVRHFVEQVAAVPQGPALGVRVHQDIGDERVGGEAALEDVPVDGAGAGGERVERAAPQEPHVEARLGGREEELYGPHDRQHSRDGAMRPAAPRNRAGGGRGGGGGGGREEPRWGRLGGERGVKE